MWYITVYENVDGIDDYEESNILGDIINIPFILIYFAFKFFDVLTKKENSLWLQTELARKRDEKFSTIIRSMEKKFLSLHRDDLRNKNLLLRQSKNADQ
jgi:hypothetical protein